MSRTPSLPLPRVLFCAALAVGGLAAQAGRAEPSGDSLEIVVQGRRDACVHASNLRARVSRYSKSLDAAGGLRVRVERQGRGMQFSVARGDRVLARRLFESLPSSCDDRRDTLAVAIALAVDNAAAEADSDESNAAEDAVTADVTALGGAAGNTTVQTVNQSASNAARTNEPSLQQTTAQLTAAQARQPSAAPEPPAPKPPQKPDPEDDSAAESDDDVASDEDKAEADDREPEPEAPADRDGPVALLRAGARQVWRVMPEQAIAFAAGVELPVGQHAGMQLTALVSLPIRSALESRLVRTQLFATEALGCGGTALGPLGLQACGGVAGGAVAASGEDFYQNTTVTLAWVATLARVSVTVPADAAFRLRLFGDGFINVVRPKVQALGTDAETAEMPAGAAAGIEIIVVWP